MSNRLRLLLPVLTLPLLFTGGCRPGGGHSSGGLLGRLMPLDTIAPISALPLPTMQSRIGLHMPEELVVASLGPPQRREKWGCYYPIGSEDKELMYWNRQDATHALIVGFHNNQVDSISIDEFPDWALNPSLLQSCIGQSKAQIKKRFGVPQIDEPESPYFMRQGGSVEQVPDPKHPGRHWFYTSFFNRPSGWIDVQFDRTGHVRVIDARPIRVHPL